MNMNKHTPLCLSEGFWAEEFKCQLFLCNMLQVEQVSMGKFYAYWTLIDGGSVLTQELSEEAMKDFDAATVADKILFNFNDVSLSCNALCYYNEDGCVQGLCLDLSDFWPKYLSAKENRDLEMKTPEAQKKKTIGLRL